MGLPALPGGRPSTSSWAPATGPCAVLMIGSRREDRAHYPVNELAATYDASVQSPTDDPEQAYADWRGWSRGDRCRTRGRG